MGRDDEMALVRSLLTSPGAHCCLFLSGDPGIGKTAILDAAASATEQTVLRARGVQYETEIAFAGLDELLHPLRDAVNSLDPKSAMTLNVALGLQSGERPDTDAVAEAALTLLQTTSKGLPVLLAVDDVQWLDRGTAEVLRIVADHHNRSTIRVVATYRLGVDFSYDCSEAIVHEVSSLTDADAAQLVAIRYPALPPRVAQRVIGEARGNPLLLLELPKSLGSNHTDDSASLAGVLPLTPRLNTLYAANIAELTAGTRKFLLLAALDGTREFATVQLATPGSDAAVELNAAADARLLTVDGRWITFRNEVIRSAVVANSTASERSTAHRALAAALTDRPDQQVWHLADATSGPDEDVAALLERRAEHWRRRGDVAGATAALYRAAELSQDGEECARRKALAAYFDAQVLGDLMRVSSQISPVRTLETGGAASLQSAITTAFVAFDEDGNIDFAHRLLTDAITDCLDRADREGAIVDERLVVEAIQNLLTVCLYGGRDDLWKAFYAIVSRRGWQDAPLLRLCTLMMADPTRTAAAVVAELDAMIRTLVDEQNPTTVARVAAAGQYVDRVRDCRPALLRIFDSGHQGAAVSAAIYALILVCVDDVRTGRWDDAHTLTNEGIRLCEANGYLLPSWPLRLARAWLAAGRGDEQTARHDAGAVMRWASLSGADGPRKFAHHILAVSALGRGEWEEAYTQVSIVNAPGQLPNDTGHALWAALDTVEAAVRTRRHGDARAHVAALRGANVALISTRLAFVVAASSAMVSTDTEFESLFEAALEMPDVADWPVERARVEMLYGERLRRNRANAKAREHLLVALNVFTELGAKTWMGRAEAELHATGRLVQQGDDAVVGTLTPQEHRVAQLAAAGLTNRQIAEQLAVSHRTVGAHLEQIFPKLCITSRAALRAAMSGLPASTVDGAGP